MNGKSAISVLLEFCVQQRVASPQYEPVIQNDDPKMFAFQVSAFGLKAKGFGRSKQEAKHAGSKLIIDRLTELGKFIENVKEEVPSPPPTPLSPQSPTSPNDSTDSSSDNAVGTLITFCQQRQLQTPIYDELMVTGQDHKRAFTFGCRLGKFETSGTGATKKEARRRAAVQMLELLDEVFKEYDAEVSDIASSMGRSIELVPNVIPILDVPSVEQILDEYRKLKKPYIQPVKDALRFRKNFFLKLPKSNRYVAQKILLNNHNVGMIDAEDVVDQVFRALNLTYEIKSMSVPHNFKRFCLIDTKYDCVIIHHVDVFFVRIIDYLKTMLNI